MRIHGVWHPIIGMGALENKKIKGMIGNKGGVTSRVDKVKVAP